MRIDPGHEIIADLGEHHGSKSVEDGACRRRWTVGFPGQDVVTGNGFIEKVKSFEPRKCKEVSGHRIGCDVQYME
jgi:hypothetical protein